MKRPGQLSADGPRINDRPINTDAARAVFGRNVPPPDSFGTQSEWDAPPFLIDERHLADAVKSLVGTRRGRVLIIGKISGTEKTSGGVAILGRCDCGKYVLRRTSRWRKGIEAGTEDSCQRCKPYINREDRRADISPDREARARSTRDAVKSLNETSFPKMRPETRAKMRAMASMVSTGTDWGSIAEVLGYANAQTAKVMWRTRFLLLLAGTCESGTAGACCSTGLDETKPANF